MWQSKHDFPDGHGFGGSGRDASVWCVLKRQIGEGGSSGSQMLQQSTGGGVGVLWFGFLTFHGY